MSGAEILSGIKDLSKTNGSLGLTDVLYCEPSVTSFCTLPVFRFRFFSFVVRYAVANGSDTLESKTRRRQKAP